MQQYVYCYITKHPAPPGHLGQVYRVFPGSKRKQLLDSMLPICWPGFLHISLFFSGCLWLPEHDSSSVLWLTIIVGNSMVTQQCSDVKIMSSNKSENSVWPVPCILLLSPLTFLSTWKIFFSHSLSTYLLPYWFLHLKLYRTTENIQTIQF